MVSDSCFAFLLSRVSGVAAARKENFRFDCQSAAVLLFIYFLYLAGRMPKDRRLLPSCPPPATVDSAERMPRWSAMKLLIDRVDQNGCSTLNYSFRSLEPIDVWP